jgi:hypothetical protein
MARCEECSGYIYTGHRIRYKYYNNTGHTKRIVHEDCEIAKSAAKPEPKKPSNKPATDKQKSIIERCRDRGDWFDAFDGLAYGTRGPSDEQIAKMTSHEASGLIEVILADRY